MSEPEQTPKPKRRKSDRPFPVKALPMQLEWRLARRVIMEALYPKRPWWKDLPDAIDRVLRRWRLCVNRLAHDGWAATKRRPRRIFMRNCVPSLAVHDTGGPCQVCNTLPCPWCWARLRVLELYRALAAVADPGLVVYSWRDEALFGEDFFRYDGRPADEPLDEAEQRRGLTETVQHGLRGFWRGDQAQGALALQGSFTLEPLLPVRVDGGRRLVKRTLRTIGLAPAAAFAVTPPEPGRGVKPVRVRLGAPGRQRDVEVWPASPAGLARAVRVYAAFPAGLLVTRAESAPLAHWCLRLMAGARLRQSYGLLHGNRGRAARPRPGPAGLPWSVN
jgi:hypothetical protein